MQDISSRFMEEVSRRSFLFRGIILGFGGFATLYSGITYDIEMSKREKAEKAKRIGEHIRLRLGETYEVPVSYRVITYTGSPTSIDFSLSTYFIHSPEHSYRTLIFPANTSEVKVFESRFSVLKVTPEEIILSYLGDS